MAITTAHKITVADRHDERDSAIVDLIDAVRLTSGFGWDRAEASWRRRTRRVRRTRR